MFSLTRAAEHKRRRRIFASAYSKSTISQDRVQGIIRNRTSRLVRFISTHVTPKSPLSGKKKPIVCRNIFRALQADIFTAFAFADETGTQYLENLGHGINSSQELGMDSMDLCHDEKRDPFFFWESEVPFKYLARFIGQHGPSLHINAHRWLVELVAKHENRSSKPNTGNSLNNFAAGTWDKLSSWQCRETGLPLEREECLSEILDHAGKAPAFHQTMEKGKI